jgi:hypothetical protein
MNKHMILFSLMICSLSVMGQQTETVTDEMFSNGQGGFRKPAFKARQPTEDKSEIYDVTGIGQTTYLASNTMDGTIASYEHSIRIQVGLTTPAAKGMNCQLIFYGPNEKVQQAVSSDNGAVSIYYPIAVYESMRSRLEQALAARKKIQVKVALKTNGYREGVLVF